MKLKWSIHAFSMWAQRSHRVTCGRKSALFRCAGTTSPRSRRAWTSQSWVTSSSSTTGTCACWQPSQVSIAAAPPWVSFPAPGTTSGIHTGGWWAHRSIKYRVLIYAHPLSDVVEDLVEHLTPAQLCASRWAGSVRRTPSTLASASSVGSAWRSSPTSPAPRWWWHTTTAVRAVGTNRADRARLLTGCTAQGQARVSMHATDEGAAEVQEDVVARITRCCARRAGRRQAATRMQAQVRAAVAVGECA